ncbi:hypothetical protein AB0L63_29155 [Nocardia sp. NPDC051990]|uniref:hypothetical protein n=1 Tax=Nocardia sp. NPDC051990 TaxID=3155285 RepID=UPI00342B8FF0
MSLQTALGDPSTITVPGGHTWLIYDPHAFGELITNVIREPVIGPDATAARPAAAERLPTANSQQQGPVLP